MDVFEIVYAGDPVVSPDGQTIAFHRYFMDIMTDRRRSDLWIIDADGENLRQISDGVDVAGPAVFTPSGNSIAFVVGDAETSKIYLRNLDTGETTELGQDLSGPSNLAFSPDGDWLAFTMPVDYEPETLGEMPPAPDGAEWAKPLIVETRFMFKFDGVGYLPFSSHQVFLVPANGGAVQQITAGRQDHYSPLTWLPDSSALLLSINVKNDVNRPLDSDIVRLDLSTRDLTVLTSQLGQDLAPQISPDGRRMAWVGNEDTSGLAHLFNNQLYSANLDGSDVRNLTVGADLGVKDFAWHHENGQIYVQYEERGHEVLAVIDEEGSVTQLTDELSGWELDQPYVQGQFSVSSGTVAFTQGNSTTPTELAAIDPGGRIRVLTDLNRSLRNTVRFIPAVEHSVKSSFDQREIEYWIMRPPDFDANKSYPMILQIHGGPWAAYGAQFAANNQLYAAAGYVVVYGNPRGSTGYGQEFTEIIDHDYPNRDYDDLMDIADAAIAMGFIDEKRLYVTGGSGGGTLTAWIVGKTDRFRAAAVVNPAINWISHGLTGDESKLYVNRWFANPPWIDPIEHWSHSPLSLVGNVNTPTMIMTGEEDWRTPISEAEQYYNALQIEGVDTALLRVPGASHWIEARPSHQVAKVNAILAWFERYPSPRDSSVAE